MGSSTIVNIYNHWYASFFPLAINVLLQYENIITPIIHNLHLDLLSCISDVAGVCRVLEFKSCGCHGRRVQCILTWD